MTERDFYSGPTLPGYKVAFKDALGTVVYVSSMTGETRQMDMPGRLRRWITSLHGFEPLHVLIQDYTVRLILMVLFASLGVIATCTGLYLALLARPRSPRAAKQPIEF